VPKKEIDREIRPFFQEKGREKRSRKKGGLPIVERGGRGRAVKILVRRSRTLRKNSTF